MASNKPYSSKLEHLIGDESSSEEIITYNVFSSGHNCRKLVPSLTVPVRQCANERVNAPVKQLEHFYS